jgi:uncharacterized protein (DUF2147 family)
MRPTAFACLLSSALVGAGAAAAQSAEGLWRTQPGDTGAYLHVRIAPCADGGTLCGEIVEAVGATRTDLPGRAIIAGMAPDGPGAWSGGTIWAPDEDRIYRSKMALTAAGLKVEGCVLVICRGQTWTRID